MPTKVIAAGRAHPPKACSFEVRDRAGTQGSRSGRLIPKAAMRDRSVEGLVPSRYAAPSGPPMRHRHASSARTRFSRSNRFSS